MRQFLLLYNGWMKSNELTGGIFMEEGLKQRGKSLWLVVGVIAASICCTFLFWLILPESSRVNENTDYVKFYEPVARNILAGNGFVVTDGTPAIRYPPGYPILLAGIFKLSEVLSISEVNALSMFTLLSMGLAASFLFLIARSVWGTLPALISSFVWMTYPFVLWFTKQPNSEIPFLVTLYGGVCLFWFALRRKGEFWLYFFSGIVIGLAMLIRPIAIGIGFLMGIIIWTTLGDIKASSRIFLILTLLLGNLVAILPWQLWMFSNTRKTVLLSSGSVPGIVDGLIFAVNVQEDRQGIPVPNDVETFMHDLRSRQHELKSARSLLSLMLEELKARPKTVLKLLTIKAARSWFGTYSGRFEKVSLLIQAGYLIPLLLGTWKAWKQGGAAKQLTIIVWAFLLYFWGMTIIALSILRYLVPGLGLLIVLVSVFFSKAPKNQKFAIT
jgi:4-amino-4-deoxy-L-arabinose transferase-like glycosyltransferase